MEISIKIQTTIQKAMEMEITIEIIIKDPVKGKIFFCVVINRKKNIVDIIYVTARVYTSFFVLFINRERKN